MKFSFPFFKFTEIFNLEKKDIMNHVANIPKKKSLNSFRPSTSRIPVSEMVCKSVLSLTSECQSIPQGSLHCYVLGRKDSEV